MTTRGRTASTVHIGVATVVAGLVVGCGGPPRAHTTFLDDVDLVDMTDRMALSFAGDDVVGARNDTDRPWVIGVDRVLNRTNEIIPSREKWLYVVRLRALLAESRLSRSRALVWVIPPERWPNVATELDPAAHAGERTLAATHLLTPEFHALTITSGRGRSDTYLCSFQLVDLRRGSIVWEDGWEVARAVRGRTYD